MRFKLPLLLCTLGLASLTACSQPPASTASNSEASPASTSATAPALAGYSELSDVVAKTQIAVETNDFAKAQQEFDLFESVWSPVEDGIKEKSSESYDAIEQDMDQVNAALKSSQSEQAIAALQAMNEHILSIP